MEHMERRTFTSESVTEGHPDKICDNISDAILDACLRQDPMSRVACEVSITTDFVLVMGEITTNANVDYENVVRDTIRRIGYDSDEKYFNCDTCEVKVLLDSQSSDIAMGVNESIEVRGNSETESVGAGDQGLMFGYACDETETMMPYPIDLAHKLTRQLTKVRKDGILPYLRPDGKSQVTIAYDENGVPVHIDAIVISTQHSEDVPQEQIHLDVKEYVIKPIVDNSLISNETKIYINPTGRFVIGGPHGDSGLTGRKIIVDTYGGYARHGGGAFSGKDCTKVDRSASYMARYIAKNIVATGMAKKCEIQLSYAIGVAEPTNVRVDTFGTSKDVSDYEWEKVVREVFDLTPLGIIKTLDLRQPIYEPTSAYGHFGRADVDLPWERTDKMRDVLLEVL